MSQRHLSPNVSVPRLPVAVALAFFLFAGVPAAFSVSAKPDAKAKSTAVTSPPAKPGVATALRANAKNLDGKPVATFVGALDVSGQFDATAPYAAITIFTVDANGAAGGEILLLVPPAELEKTVRAIEPVKAARGTAFGSKLQIRRVDATLRIVGGEPVLVKGGDVAKLARIGKPSALRAKQQAAAAAGNKYPEKDFIVSQTGRSGRVETQAMLDRLLRAINATRKAEEPKATLYTMETLRREIRNGVEFRVADETTGTTWHLVWK
ncbi:MAG: hypothetical protein LBD14_02160 [Puniceicoccales bacterium]|nr:hypothetical protein [Puniceicoccales bacterium]